MKSDLVIVESPAKAKTIERYLGPGYTVLASYGHVRDLPENPGKGQLGVDVEHDFAPTYEISPDRHRQLAADREGGPRRQDRLPRHRPRSRGRGDRLARRRGHQPVPGADRPGDLQRDHRAGHPRGVRPPARDRPGPGRCPADPPDRRPDGRLHAQSAHLAQGPVGPVGRSRPVGGGPPGRRPRTRDPRVHRASSTGPIEAAPGRARRRDVHAPISSGSTARSRSSATAETAERHVAALRASRPVVDTIAVKRSKRSPAPPFTTSTLQQEASRKLGLQPEADDVGRPAAVRGCRDPGWPGRA